MTETPDDTTNAAEDEAAARSLRLLRRLVTVLTAVMIVGIVTVVVLMAIRLQGGTALPVPDRIGLPEGATATAVTVAEGMLLIVTDQRQLLVYDPETGALQKTVPLD